MKPWQGPSARAHAAFGSRACAPRPFASWAVAIGLALVCGLVSAADVYRCGPDGRQYGDTPCADGRRVDVADARSPAQVQAGQRVVVMERQLAKQAARDRHAAERAATRTPGAFGLGQAHTAPERAAPAKARPPKAQHARSTSRASHRQGEGVGTFRAIAPASPPPKD